MEVEGEYTSPVAIGLGIIHTEFCRDDIEEHSKYDNTIDGINPHGEPLKGRRRMRVDTQTCYRGQGVEKIARIVMKIRNHAEFYRRKIICEPVDTSEKDNR